MHWLVPLILVFGFLTGYAPHDGSFSVVVPLAASAALVPTAFALWRERQWSAALLGVVLFIVLSFAVAMSFAALALACGAGAIFLASRYAETSGRRLLIAGTAGLLLALVIEPAGLALGLWHYDALGLYYGVPPYITLSWFCCVAAGAAVGLRLLSSKKEVPRGFIISSIVVLAFATGVCTAFGLWPAALLGLLLLQFGWHVLHYV